MLIDMDSVPHESSASADVKWSFNFESLSGMKNNQVNTLNLVINYYK